MICALALILWFQFDHENLIDQVPGWDWSLPSTWRSTRLFFGRKVGQSCHSGTLLKMYSTFLEPTSIRSSKKTHLARRAMPSIMEDMEYVLSSLSL